MNQTGLIDLLKKTTWRHETPEDARTGIAISEDDERYALAPFESFRVLSGASDYIKARGSELPIEKRLLLT